MRRLLTPPRGFSLLEVLITLVILMFGLLGIAGLMAKGQRASLEAFQRQQAISLADDMAERIRGNPTQYAAYVAGAPLNSPLGEGVSYNDFRQGNVPNCNAATNCSTTDLATYDLALWDGLLNGYYESQVGTGNSVGGIVNAQGCIEEIDSPANVCGAAGTTISHSVRISVAWQGNDVSVAPTISQCGTGHYDVDTKRRLISLDVMVLQSC